MVGNKTVIFHIGMHKTGTTALQKLFKANEKSINQAGVFFPKNGRQNATSQIIHSNLAWEALEHSGFSPKLGRVDDVVEEVKSQGYSSSIISTEGLSRLSSPSMFLNKFDSFYKKIIFYVRRQDLVAPSRYTEDLKFGYPKDFDTWLSEKSNIYFNFNRHYRRWQEHADEVIVRVLENDSLVGGNVFEDFFYAVGHPLKIENSYSKRENERIGACAALSLMNFNNFLKLAADENSNIRTNKMKIINCFRRLSNQIVVDDVKFSPFSYEEAVDYYGHFSRSNIRLFKKSCTDGFSPISRDEYSSKRVRTFSDLPDKARASYQVLLFSSLCFYFLAIGDESLSDYYLTEAYSLAPDKGKTVKEYKAEINNFLYA